MKPRRKHGGLLSGLVKYPQEKHRKGKRPPSLTRRIVTWIVGTVVVLGLAGFLIVIFWGLFHPDAGAADAGEFPVEELIANPPGYPPEEGIVAAAFVRIRGRRVPIPLTEATRAGIAVGSTLHVNYTWHPKYQRTTVDRWTLLPKEATPPSGLPAPPGP